MSEFIYVLDTESDIYYAFRRAMLLTAQCSNGCIIIDFNTHIVNCDPEMNDYYGFESYVENNKASCDLWFEGLLEGFQKSWLKEERRSHYVENIKHLRYLFGSVKIKETAPLNVPKYKPHEEQDESISLLSSGIKMEVPEELEIKESTESGISKKTNNTTNEIFENLDLNDGFKL